MIIVYSKQKTERLCYVLDLIFNSILNDGFELTDDKKQFQQSSLPKINYSDEDSGDGLFLKPHPLLFETDISAQKIEPFTYKNNWCFFPTSANSFIPFDIFACSFYLASRYEEYLSTERDIHGRFPAKESIQYKNNVLDEPVVNLWANLLAEKIMEKYPGFSFPEKNFKFLVTIDVDNAWACKNKKWWVQCGGIIKSAMKANFSAISERIKVLTNREEDPYDTFGFIESVMGEYPGHLKFFFLLGNRGKYDRNISWQNKKLQALIRNLSMKYETGIHPSYASTLKPGMLATEIKRLEKNTGNPVTGSRQHYLKLSFPQTYNQLIENGIKKDFTMGYADAIGFRAGLCMPFRFFDLEKNITTDLTVFPLHVMDVTLQDYLRLTPVQAVEKTNELAGKVKAAGGTFIVLWHNESLSNKGRWEGWQQVFLQTVKNGISLENE